MYMDRLIVEVEECQAAPWISRSSFGCDPGTHLSEFRWQGDDRMCFRGVLIDIEHILIGNQRAGKVVELGQVATEDQRRARDSPESQLGPRLFVSEPRLPRLTPARMRRQRA